MAPDKLSRDPGAGGDESSEGVRIIAAEELEEAAERREVVRRRAPDEPGFKDRPPGPPADVRPAIRFPLPDSADPSSVERPRPAPVDASGEGWGPDRAAADQTPVFLGEAPEASDPDPAATSPTLGPDDDLSDPPGWLVVDPPVPAAEPPEGDPAAPPAEDHVPAVFDQAADPPAAPGPRPADESEGSTALFDQAADEVVAPAAEAPPEVATPHDPSPAAAPAGEAAVGGPAPEAPAARPTPPLDAPPPPDPEADRTAPEPTGPVLDLGPASGEHQLPHWTEPPTGEVPRVVIGEPGPEDPDEDERWASFTAGSTRWRDEHDSSDHGDLVADLAADPGEPVAERLGALDTSDRLSDDAFLNFDDVDLDPSRRPARRGGRRSRSGRAGRSAPPPPPDPDPLAAIISVDEPVPAEEPAPPPPVPGPMPEAPRGRAARAAGLGSRPPAPPPEHDPASPRGRRRPPSGGGTRSGGPSGPASSGRNVPQAVVVGVALGVVALLALKAGPAVAMVLVEIVVVLAGAEYYGAVQRGGFRPATLLGLTAVAALPLAAYWRGEAAFPLVLFLVFAVGVLWYLLGVGGPVRPTANLGVTLVGVVWVGVLGAFAALILDIPSQGPSILLVAIVAAVAHDAGGFFIGRAMGRTPFTSISPGKTLEGLVGGVLSGLVAVLVVAVLLGVGPFSLGEALVFGLVTSLMAPFGDLAESLVKRDLGLKDMGSILPEHGGVLDRFDAVLFVLPTAYYAVRVLGLVG